MARGVKTPVKNIGLLVKNVVKISLYPTPFLQGGSFGELVKEWRVKNPVSVELIAGRVLSAVYDNLEQKFKDRTFDNLDLWSHLLNHGVNPVDVVLPMIDKNSIWYTGRKDFAPSVVCQTTTNPKMIPHFDAAAVVQRVVELDAVFERVLALEPVIYPKENSQEFVGAKARLFASLLTTDQVLVQTALSPLIQSCFTAWADELKTLSEEVKICSVDYIYKRFVRLAGFQKEFKCPPDFFEPCRELFQLVQSQFSALDIQSDLDNKMDSGNFDSYQSLFEYLEMSHAERSEAIVAIAGMGNQHLTRSALPALIRAPEAYTKTLKASGFSDEAAHELLSHNLRRDVRFNHSDYASVDQVAKMVERFRAAFQSAGYSDVIGSKALDGLTVILELGEHFEKIGYLRREDMGDPGYFAYYAAGCGDLNPTKPEPTPPEIIQRKVDLAVNLRQTDMLKNQLAIYFKGRTPDHRDLGSGVALKYVLESGAFNASELLTTPVRFQKALDAGVDRKIILAGKIISTTDIGKILSDDLGL